MQNFEFIITDRTKAGKFLMSTRRGVDITHVISIFDSESNVSRGKPCTGFFCHKAKKIALQFDDVDGPMVGCISPSEEVVSKLIEFCETVKSDCQTGKCKVLIHCYAGISRSTAAAFILLSILLGPNKENEALDMVVAHRPQADPNQCMVALADKLLDRKSAMTQALYLFLTTSSRTITRSGFAVPK